MRISIDVNVFTVAVSTLVVHLNFVFAHPPFSANLAQFSPEKRWSHKQRIEEKGSRRTEAEIY